MDTVASERATAPIQNQTTSLPAGTAQPPQNSELSGGSAGVIHEGFFWKETLSQMSSTHRIAVIRGEALAQVRQSIRKQLDALSPHGWYPGIPDRTLLLPDDGLRLVYGGSMGDEIGVRTLDGKTTRGFFRSEKLVSILQDLEQQER